MSVDEKLLEKAVNSCSACLLSSLEHDLDTRPIAHKDFDEFRTLLDDQLHLLLDILYQNSNFLRDPAYDNQLVQLRVNLVLLSCEQTEPNPFFQTDQKILITSLQKIFDDNLQHFEASVIKKVIETYKESLKKDSWKKQLGMTHGFPKFCEVLLKQRRKDVDGDFINFALSVGSNLASHFDPHYKTIGLKIYRHLTSLGDENLLRNLNIHEVIYSEAIQMTRKSNELEFNDHLYECLLSVVRIEGAARTTKWSKFDDVMEDLLRQVGVVGETEVFCLLLEKILKLSGGFEAPETSCDELKRKFQQENFKTLRWVKKILELMVRESPKLLNSPRVLKTFHKLYIVSVASVDSGVFSQQLTEFSRKILLVLMKVARSSEDTQELISFIETIADHQNLLNCCQKISHQIKLKNFVQ